MPCFIILLIFSISSPLTVSVHHINAYILQHLCQTLSWKCTAIGGKSYRTRYIRYGHRGDWHQITHCGDVIMSMMASQITSSVYSGAYQWKHQSSGSLAFVRGMHPFPSPHKGPVTRKMFPIDDVIMSEMIAGTSVMFARNWATQLFPSTSDSALPGKYLSIILSV